MHKLGLFPLVKRFQFNGSTRPFTTGPTLSPNLFDRHILHQFTSLTNVQELGMNDLDIPSFMPQIQRYFNHFLPTVRSLALWCPKGSNRQIVFFIGLFRHLEDLKLMWSHRRTRGKSPVDPVIVPPFTPPLNGRLTTFIVTDWEDLLADMIDQFGGIRFRHLDLMPGGWE
jgi:hypothetical protein